MRVSITDRQAISEQDLRTTSELAPALALPWLITLRYILLACETFLVLIAIFGAHILLPVLPIAALLAALFVSNIFFRRLSDAVGARRAVGAILVADVAVLTAALALSGGPANPFSLLYLVEITLSAVVLSKLWTRLLGVLSILGYGVLFFFHVPVPVLEGHHPGQSFSIHLIGMWIAFVVAASLITILVSRVSEILRKHEEKLLRLQNLLSRQEKIASLATLAAGAAHEMGTPLATIAIAARELENYALQSESDADLAAEAKLIRLEVDRCSRILRDMGTQGAEFAGETPALVAIPTLLQQVRASFPKPQQDTIQVDAAENLCASLPVETTRQVLTALVKNAVEASASGQIVQLAGEAGPAVLRFTVKDSGCGMSPDVLQHVAEPFYTTKQASRGMGLGTFLVRAFAEDAGGRLLFDSAVDHGTTAILELPLADKI